MSCPKKRSRAACAGISGKSRGWYSESRSSGRRASIFFDSDWAGCQRTRKSTNGGGIVWNGACLKVWSTTQTVIAMSSCEAENYAAVKGGAEGFAMQSMAKDLGIDSKIRVHTDSSACRDICGRTGIGKVRHMVVPLLWLQGAVREKKILTKFVSREDLDRHCRSFGFAATVGRTTRIAER